MLTAHNTGKHIEPKTEDSLAKSRLYLHDILQDSYEAACAMVRRHHRGCILMFDSKWLGAIQRLGKVAPMKLKNYCVVYRSINRSPSRSDGGVHTYLESS
jgi:hypothetical protein